MKKSYIIPIAAVVALIASGCFVACGDKDDGKKKDPSKPDKTEYSVSYDGAGGTGAPPAVKVSPDTEITIADAIARTGYSFNGWTYSDKTYEPGEKYKVTADTTFTAAWTANTYTVRFDGNGGRGEMQDISLTYDVETELPECEYMLGAAELSGWALSANGEVKYTDGQAVKNLTTENGAEVTLYAVWDIPAPIGFSRAEYFYDKAGGEDLELPVTLNGCNVNRVEVDDVALDAELWSYDADKKVIVLSFDYVILLSLGDHTVKLVTDSVSDVVPLCKLTTENSIVSSFDVSDKIIKYGVQLDIDYTVTGEVTVDKLVNGDIIVPTDMWNFDAGTLTVSGAWIQKFINKSNFTLYLSNNDTYSFDIYNNTVFYTDYDVTTVHNDTESNTGQNPMYQYYDNVAIVDAPAGSGMIGKALRITPNTSEVLYDCNGYITLAADNFDSTWRKGGFKAGKYYAVSFDYYTVGTSVGEFAYRVLHKTYYKPLLLGADNDNTLHTFSDIISYDEIDGAGLILWAKFYGANGAGDGEIYIDNFAIIELDSAIDVTAGNYVFGSGVDYEFTVENAIPFGLYCNGDQIDYILDADGCVTVAAEDMSRVSLGENEFILKTAVYEKRFTVRVTDNRRAELTETRGDFSYYGSDEFALKGVFEQATVTSLKQKAKSDNGGYDNWEFWHGDITTNFAEYATVKADRLEIDREFLKRFYGTTEFEAEFSNGNVQTFTVVSDVAFINNFDETYITGYFDGNPNFGRVEHSGMHGSDVELKERVVGNKAMYVYDTSNSEEPNLFTVKFHRHEWTWYTVKSDNNRLNRITFKYNISDVSGVYFLIMKETTEDYESNFFGGGSVENINSWQIVRYDLICDGREHTFDSGWFTYADLRMSRIVAPKFEAADGRYMMFDDYAVTQIDKPQMSILYEKGQTGDCTLSFGERTVSEIIYNGDNYAIVSGGKVTLDKTKLETLSFGKHKFNVKTDAGTLPLFVTVKGEGVVEIARTEYDYKYGSGDLQIDGTVEKTTVVAAAKRGSFKVGSYEYDNSPTALDINNFEVTGGKLTVKQALLDTLYLSTDITLGFANGESVTVKINSDVRFFSDFDGTNLTQPLRDGGGNGYNGYMSQDSTQMSYVDDGTGNTVLRYCTADATLGHATGDIHNMILDIAVGWGTEGSYAKFLADGSAILSADKDYIITFDYKIINAEGQNVTYGFRLHGRGELDITDTEGTFTYKLEGGLEGVQTVGICCKTTGGAAGCYMLIDNYRILAVDKE